MHYTHAPGISQYTAKQSTTVVVPHGYKAVLVPDRSGEVDKLELMASITQYVSAKMNIPIEDMKGQSRKKHFAAARRTAMYIMHRTTVLSLGDISRYFGDRHHTTALHAVQTTQGHMDSYPDYKEQIEGYIKDIH